jgi:hypothetical protein
VPNHSREIIDAALGNKEAFGDGLNDRGGYAVDTGASHSRLKLSQIYATWGTGVRGNHNLEGIPGGEQTIAVSRVSNKSWR